MVVLVSGSREEKVVRKALTVYGKICPEDERVYAEKLIERIRKCSELQGKKENRHSRRNGDHT